MPRNRKLFINNSVIEITFRAEEGLPLVASPYMKLLLSGILAQAQTLYPVRICHYIVMGNHMHLICVVNNPENVPHFVEYLKRESSHMINRLTGRRKHTVWCDGYDSPVILDPEKVIQRIKYLYTNPAEAGLVNSIEEYPNLNSWAQFLNGDRFTLCYKVRRLAVPTLSLKPLSPKKAASLVDELMEHGTRRKLILEPYAWLSCFKETASSKPADIKKLILKEVKDAEERLHQARTIPVIGPKKLMSQDPRQAHTPVKFGKRMICLASRKTLRIFFIEWYRAMADYAADTISKLRFGLRINPPPGFFHPGGYLQANLGPAFSPLPLS